MTQKLNLFALQANNYEIQHQIFEGEEHLVVPVVIMCEGVHCGSDGPTYHSIDELGKYPASWNGIPVSINHPKEGEDYVSANSPSVLEDWTVGRIFNTYVDGEKLKAECWLNTSALCSLSPEAYEYIVDKRPLEVSMGAFYDKEITEGDWNGEHYSQKAVNLRPDHLALLPGGKGACSWEDGAGIRVNSRKTPRHDAVVSRYLSVNEVVTGMFDIADMLRKELMKKQASENSDYYYLEEILPGNKFIYEKTEYFDNASVSKYYQQDYLTLEDGSVTLVEDTKVEVSRLTQYIPKQEEMEPTLSVNIQKSIEGAITKMIKTYVDKLISAKVFTELQRATLETYSEDMLKSMVDGLTVHEPVKPSKEELSAIFKASFASKEEFMKIVPDELKEQMECGLRLHAEQKQKLIEKITGYSQAFTVDELAGKSHQELTKLASLVPAEEPIAVNNYTPFGVQTPVTHTNTIEPLLPFAFTATDTVEKK